MPENRSEFTVLLKAWFQERVREKGCAGIVQSLLWNAGCLPQRRVNEGRGGGRSGWEFWYCQSGPWCFWFLGSMLVSLSCVCIIIFGLLLYFMWVILLRVLQRNGTNWRVHIYELVSGIMEAEKSHNLQSASCRPENTDGWNFSW